MGLLSSHWKSDDVVEDEEDDGGFDGENVCHQVEGNYVINPKPFLPGRRATFSPSHPAVILYSLTRTPHLSSKN